MKPDEKYMNQVSTKAEEKEETYINFIPPSFIASISRNMPTKNNSALELFPSETQSSELYCYYSSFGDCDKKNSSRDLEMRVPSPSEILTNFNLDLDEITDLERQRPDNEVDNIFLQIERRNPGIIGTFSSYRIPYPIARVIIKRIIKLTLLYSKKK